MVSVVGLGLRDVDGLTGVLAINPDRQVVVELSFDETTLSYSLIDSDSCPAIEIGEVIRSPRIVIQAVPVGLSRLVLAAVASGADPEVLSEPGLAPAAR